MKTSACSAVCMAMAILLCAPAVGATDLFNCRDYVVEGGSNLSKTKRIEKDLKSGIWTTTTSGRHEETYLFTDDGLVQILVTNEQGFKTYQSKNWEITEFNGLPVLTLSKLDRKKRQWIVVQTCEGITLTDLAGNMQLWLDYQPLRSSSELNLFQAYLSGEWTNVSAFETERKKGTDSNFLRYQFSVDGYFSCEYGNQSETITENGTWEISKDAQFLLLQITESNAPENGLGTAVIRIAHLDEHGLVLEQVMKTNVINDFFAATNKTFTFIK